VGAAAGAGGAVEVEGGHAGLRGGRCLPRAGHARLGRFRGACGNTTAPRLALVHYLLVGLVARRAFVWRRVLKTDHWFYGLFKSHPDLITLLLPSVGAPGASAVPSLGPDSPGDVLFRYDAPELKAVNHRLEGCSAKNVHLEQCGAQAAFHGLIAQR